MKAEFESFEERSEEAESLNEHLAPVVRTSGDMNVVTRERIVEKTVGTTHVNAYAGARRKTSGVVAVEIQRFASKPGSGYREPRSSAVWNCDLHDRFV
jgi:hypothetical protein